MGQVTNGKRLHISPATADDAAAVKQLLDASEHNSALSLFIDWMDLGDYWIKAVRDDETVGCLQVVFARPIARLEYLAVDEELEPYVRAKIVRSLLLTGERLLKKAGAQAVSGTIPFALKSYKRQLKKLGAVASAQGNVMTKRLQ